MRKVQGTPPDDATCAFFERVSRAGLPVFSLGASDYPDQYLLYDQIKPDLPKAVVITIPRSGTHFTSQLLSDLGMVNTGLHLAPALEPDIVEDRRGRNCNARGKLSFRRHRLPLTDVFAMLGPGQFVQGHIRHQSDFVAALADCKIIYVERNLRNVAVSAMRFIARLAKAGHAFGPDLDARWVALDDGPLKMIGYLQSFGAGLPALKQAIEPWREESNAFVLDFDILTGADANAAVQALSNLAQFLDLRVNKDKLKEVLSAAKGKETWTWSGQLSDWQALWNDDVEALFQHKVLQCGTAGNMAGNMAAEAYEQMVQQVTPSGPQNRKAVLAWMHGEELVSRVVKINPAAPYENFMPQVVAERLGAQGQPVHASLATDPAKWGVQDVVIEQNEAWLSIHCNGDHTGHKHVSMALALPEPLTVLTFSFVLRMGQGHGRLVVQAGNDAGQFKSLINANQMQVVQIKNAGDCRSLATRIEQVDEERVKVCHTGLIGAGNAAYVRIYLCDASGNLAFSGAVNLQIQQPAVSFGVNVFDFNDPP